MNAFNNTSLSSSTQVTNGKYRSYKDFMISHRITDENKSESRPSTNTSMVGGSYHIPDEEYSTFLQLYYRDIMSKKMPEYLTEKQLQDDGPIVVDLDLRYEYEITTKQHTKEHIEDLFYSYLDELKKIYQFDETKKFNIFIMEKPNVKRLDDRKITKDGIHILISLKADRITQRILRERMIKNLSEMWDDLPLKNKNWEDIYDEGITIGYTNWTLYGSCKKECEAYKVTNIYEVSYDETDDEFCITTIQPEFYDISKNLEKLSVRYKDNLSLFFKNDFCLVHNEYKKNVKEEKKTRKWLK